MKEKPEDLLVIQMEALRKDKKAIVPVSKLIYKREYVVDKTGRQFGE